MEKLANKTIFIIGAGEWQLPAFTKAREMGLKILTVDKDPQAPGFALSDEFYVVDTRDVEECHRIAREKKISGVMTMASDYALPAVSFIAEKMGLVGLPYQVSLFCLDKAKVKERLISGGAATAKGEPHTKSSLSMQIASSNPSFNFPLVIKPSIGCGSKGVSLILDGSGLESYLASTNHKDMFLLEEYLEGDEVSVEGIVYKNNIYHIVITEKVLSPPPYFVEIGHYVPADISRETEEKIKSVCELVIKALNLDNCAFHIEIRLTTNGPMIIEVGARMGGGAITSDLIPLSTGFDMVSTIIRLSLGKEIDLAVPQARAVAGMRFFQQEGQGILKKIEKDPMLDGLNGLQRVTFLVKEGERVLPLKSSSERMGYVIANGGCREEVEGVIQKAIKGVRFLIE